MNYPIQNFYSKEESTVLTEKIKPPPKLSLSEWANEKRILSKEDSAEPGQYSTTRAPYQKEIQDEITNELVTEIVIVQSSQSGKTLISTNTIGYYVDQDPSPIMYVIETLDKAENFSKTRLDPMIRDNPYIKIDRKLKSGGNTTLEKFFPGGYLSIVGANSAAGMTSKPIRILVLDEIDNYPRSIGKLGNPVDLAIQRTETFDNKKIIKISSPGLEGFSNIWPAFEETDMRYYNVPCPHCGHLQNLIFPQLKFPDKVPDNCYYECIECHEKIYERYKFRMIEKGKWIPKHPDIKNKPGFHLSRLYSVFSSWSSMVKDFLSARKKQHAGDSTSMQVFYNSALAITWNPFKSPTESTELIKRVEKYIPDEKNIILPRKVLLLTAGMDVQDDRIEIQVIGWGLDEESWVIEYRILTGEPALPALWNELDQFLLKRYMHPLGIRMGITASGIDTGGHYSMKVYDFTRDKSFRRIYALKGSSINGKPIAPKKPSYNNKGNVPLYFVGTDSAKDLIYGRLRVKEAGAGYMHFSDKFCDDEYFEQLTSNHKVKLKRNYEFQLQPGKRDEVLDTWVYGLAALRIYNRPLQSVKSYIEKYAAEKKEGTSKQGRQPMKKNFAKIF